MGEAAYWVNYDVDVPLFLPLYVSARAFDLRQFALSEQPNGSKKISVPLFLFGSLIL